jgi:hypothetical protein
MSSEDLKKFKQELRKLNRKREQLVEGFFSKDRLAPGSYMETRIRCGKAGCHCHKDGGHPTMRISRWVDGKLISKIVRLDDREWVAEAAANYKARKQAMSEIAKINLREKEVLKKIIELKSQIYQ